MNLPKTVKGGDKLTATYLNSIRTALKDLQQQMVRRRLLPGSGYSIKESAGGSSLCIHNQSEFLRQASTISYTNTDFSLRIKPQELCKVSEDGEWDVILQVHIGEIRNAKGESVLVESMEKKDGEGEGEGGDAGGEGEETVSTWDMDDWVDVGKVSKSTIEVWVKFTDNGGDLPTDAVFSTEEKDDKSIYIAIGQIQPDTVDDESCYFIDQYQIGTIELGATGGADMPFDAQIVAIENECADMGVELPEEEKNKKYVNINEGRVFLPEARYATIPAKENYLNAANSLEAKDGYLILELTQDSSGNIKYQYRISESLEGTEVTASEESGTSSEV
ncbi:MAG: hypothetical protein R3Y56_07305 [Akkermansia sp.]